MKYIKYLILVIFSLFLIIYFKQTQQSDYVVRAAIDIGSGATKLKVAKVNLKTKKIEVLVNTAFPVQYQEELEKSKEGIFNEKVIQTGLDALKKSKEIADRYQAEKVIAVATASFRKAKNVDAFIQLIAEKTGIKVYIIDQKLEGILGFEATASHVRKDPKDLVVWDIGGGSLQISSLDKAGQFRVYRGEEASIPFKNHVIQVIQGKSLREVNTPNPLSSKDIKGAHIHAKQIALKVDQTFIEKIKNPETEVVGIGNIFAYGIYPLVGKKEQFTQDELRQRVKLLAGKTDLDLGNDDYTNVFATNSILVLGFMQTLGIKQMNILDINNADGALVYPAFWR